MSPFPHVHREQVPITDPRWLASAQPDPEPEVDERRGLDGNGAMHAADLPSTSYTWGYLAAPAENEDIDLEKDLPVTRTLCLALSDDRTLPLQCRIRNGHGGKHDWETEKDDLLSVRRREELDTPSDRLPVRVAGEALAEAQESEVLETWTV